MTQPDPKTLIRIAREEGGEAHVEPLDLGTRVRELRKSRGWTLEQAAVKAGLARSTLSKIENGQMSPTFRCAEEAGRRVGDFGAAAVHPAIEGAGQRTDGGDQVRRRSTECDATYEHELLAGGLRKKQMLPYRAVIGRVRLRISAGGFATMARNSSTS